MNKDKIDFSGWWTELWAQVSLDPEVAKAMGYAGAALLVWTLVRYVYLRHNGSKKSPTDLLATLMLGCMLVAPGPVIPAVLGLVDWAANFVLRLLT